jgi:hypothetical protein
MKKLLNHIPLFAVLTIQLFTFQSALATSIDPNSYRPSCVMSRAIALDDQILNGEVQRSKYYELIPYDWQLKAQGQVLILPATGGFTVIDHALAQHLCGLGLIVRILDYPQPSGFTTDIKIHDQITTLVMNTLSLFLQQHPEPTALVGASLGGLYSAVAFGLSQNNADFVNKIVAENKWQNLRLIKGATMVVAGGPLAQILAYSKQELIVAQRELRQKNRNFTNNDEYFQLLEKEIQLDPLKLVPADKSSQILMMNSVSDEIVLAETQKKLWEQLGRPTKTEYTSGHVYSIIRSYLFHSAKIARFSVNLLKNQH